MPARSLIAEIEGAFASGSAEKQVHILRQVTDLFLAGASSYSAAQIDLFDGVIAMSGVYQPRHFLGDYADDDVYFNSPLYYLPELRDPWHLELYRRSRIVICVGQGAWENEALPDTRALDEVLARKGVPATFDYWGTDVEHHWYWWQKMLRHHLGVLWSG